MVQNAVFCCFRGHCPSHNTLAKVQTQGLTGKNSKPKKPKPKDLKSAPSRNNMAEPDKKKIKR